MTLGLLATGVVGSALGTRTIAAVAFGAASVVAFMGEGQDLVVWTAALVAGLVMASPATRRLAVPAAGAAAVLVAASTSNAAAVLLAWTVGSAAAVVGATPAERRWAFGLLLSDLPVAAAVVASVMGGGFVGWTGGPDNPTAALLAAAAVLRVPLAAGALDRAPEAGLVVVRTQVLVLLVVVARGDVGAALALGGAATFLVSPLSGRRAVTDVVQEAGLVAIALGTAPTGVWLPLAAGSIVHVLRYAGRGREPLERVVRVVARSGGFGGLFLAASAIPLVGAVRTAGTVGTVTTVALVVGLAGRLLAPASERLRYAAAGAVRATIVAAAAVAALALPFSVGEPTAWPGVWWLAVVLVGIVVGVVGSGWLAPARTRRPPALPTVSVPEPLSRALAPADTPGALAGTLTVLGVVASGVWIAGWWQGFL